MPYFLPYRLTTIECGNIYKVFCKECQLMYPFLCCQKSWLGAGDTTVPKTDTALPSWNSETKRDKL